MTRFFASSFFFLFAAVTVDGQGRFDYAQQWQTIDRLMEGILPQSALPEIERVRQAAISDSEYGHLIRAVMTRNTCLQMTEASPHNAIINRLKEDAEVLPFPVRAVIYSLIGEAYLNFYSQNRWRLFERTTLVGHARGDDVETWDAVRLLREITHYYQLSLADDEMLKKTPIDLFAEALHGDVETRHLRPTLFDFLAHRAIDAYTNYALWVSDFFTLTPDYFADAQTFVEMTIPEIDAHSPAYLILKLFQELTEFRLAQSDINSLADVCLKRFRFLAERGDFGAYYEKAMNDLLEVSAGHKIWGKVAYTLATHYFNQRKMVDAISLYRKIEQTALLESDRALAKEMIAEITKPEVRFQIESALLPETPALALVSCRNLEKLYVNIYNYNPTDLDDFMQRLNTFDDFPNFLTRLNRNALQTLYLPAQTDYLQHSFETKIEPLPVGNFLIVVSDSPNPAVDKSTVLVYNRVQVTNIKLLQRNNGDGRLEAYVLDARTGKPLQGAQITTIRRMYDNQQSRWTDTPADRVMTDINGMALLTTVETPRFVGMNVNKIRVNYGDDELTEDLLRIWHDSGQRRNVLATIFFTDRAIYRPGQIVYFKGIIYETDHDGNKTIQTNANTTVQLFDVNGREISKLDLTTNDFGSFNGSFILPVGLLNGQMHIRNEHGNVFFSVEEYKRPTFEVVMDAVAGNYALGDTVTVSGSAVAFAGFPASGSRVEFSVERQMQFRPLRFAMFPPRGRSTHIATGTVFANDNGQFEIKFHAIADDIRADDTGIYRYQITVDVTNLNGETQRQTQEVSLSRTPLLVDFRVPDKIFAAADNLKYPLIVTNLNGNEVTADVEVEVWSLKNPERLLRSRLWQQPDTFVIQRDDFAALFPFDPFIGEDNPSTFEKMERLATVVPVDNELDLSVLRNAASGWYFLRLKANSENNASITDHVYIQLLQPQAPINNMDEWLTVVKGSGEPGEYAVFRIAGGNDSSLVRYDVLFKNQLVERKWLTVGRIPQELQIPISEEYRGGFAVAFAMVHENRSYTALQEIVVPYTNKELDISFTTFRGQLLPGERERWTLTVRNNMGERQAAEMVATLFDASLEQFARHRWDRHFFPSRSHWNFGWQQQFNPLSFSQTIIAPQHFFAVDYRTFYERLNQIRYGGMRVQRMATGSFFAEESDGMMAFATAAPVAMNFDAITVEAAGSTRSSISEDDVATESEVAASHATIPLRANFAETAFFYPELRTNEQGEILIDFTIPEALTRWNMLGFAHTKDFMVGSIENSLITQKQVAISANLPRFFRVGDRLTLSAQVSNLTDNDLNGNAQLRFYDAFTMRSIDAQILQSSSRQSFSVRAGQNAVVTWELLIPPTVQAVTYRLTAQAGNHTDGEERSVPVMSNRTLVTEAMPFMVRGDERKDLRFDRLADFTSETLQHHRLTLEYTSNPAWNAVLALPYLMETTHQSSEQMFSRFYANTLSASIANSSPEIRRIFDQWRDVTRGISPLISNLERNQELKQALLEETPWVVQANNETEQRKRIAMLFDLNRMANEQRASLDRLIAMQGGNGGFPWFAGMPEDRFITQHIVAGLEHLFRLNALSRTDEINNMLQRALAFCDARISEDFRRRSDDERTNVPQINSLQIHYLYMCSFSRHFATDQQAFNFYMQQAETSWAQFNVYEQAMIALTMFRYGRIDVANNILRSLKERAQMCDELGMYWIENQRGHFWYQSPIETQAILIEAFQEAGNDTRAVEEMKIWLLRHKQTNNWKTTKATTKAIYALLSTDPELLGNNNRELDIRINGRRLRSQVSENIRPVAGTGYVSTTWSGNEIHRQLANLRVTNPNVSIAWGAMYWQYFEDMDAITSAETNLQMNKQMFIKRNTATGAILEPVTYLNQPKVGDIVTIRLELRADRDFEYVHLKDMRAAGFEPVNTTSGFRFQGGLGYYESIKDASVNFFITHLRRGTYVFEYDLRATNAGDFSTGITTFQSMYAPEFSAHSSGGRVSIGR